MRIIRFLEENGLSRLAAITDENLLYELPFENILELRQTAKQRKVSMVEIIQQAIQDTLPKKEDLEQLQLLVPIEAQEVWAAGVTYLRSREERNYEATGGKHTEPTIYDKVYEAKRPEIFFKSTKERTRGTGEALCLRSDSSWQVPEPELALVLDENGEIFGFTIGNDLSCRDIEGENPLYLPQAKIWKNSCSIGPAIRLAETVEDFYSFQITCRIYRNQEKVFEETAHTRDLRRTYEELSSYLVKDNIVFNGTVLLTGTSIVPPESYTLQDGDRIEIEIPGIGKLVNPVVKQAVKLVETI
ncbi:fumarylacetoacetate hydrolase family protein [Bacillus sp. ISL-18]|uniref:fumarylacetoacetate hydrolase family protein n=1 Tax=Bacillus sp. ISL-18 TaxID=2819118 RepID=UPI001BE734E2|nr:fumarylacetoacetate hydrolase family protein [Bacillus sp. ISL-18]MBT2657168.1 fumarylacetoacetate hydrolase family protein [Bacillus sp. ISL-18]